MDQQSIRIPFHEFRCCGDGDLDEDFLRLTELQQVNVLMCPLISLKVDFAEF